ncbi:hypothetical protein AB833_08995 [Chromatiales bacterium (ex Bugula neritina AB1)]|nr:hypothetical protein AB833_08995 [Chromatiales bacterium (ex Bugula neritina AB1)]
MNDPKIDKVIFWVALISITAFSVPLMLFPAEGKQLLNSALGWSTKTLGWVFLWFAIGCFAVLVYYALGRYGNVRFGGPDAKPEFSLPSWIAMLFCAGIGASVMYWGTIEWAYYYAGPPFGIEAKTQKAAEWGAMYGLFHWGFTAWAIYCIPTLPLAYLYWNRKKPVLRLSSACEMVIGKSAANGVPGKVIDVLFMFGLIGGVGTSIGLGTPMLSAALAELIGTERSFSVDLTVIAIWGGIFGFSVYSGLEKGIKLLSDINLWLIVFVLAFTFVFGPTIFILDTFTNSIGLLLQNFIEMSFYVDPVNKGNKFIEAASEGKSYWDAGGTFPEWWTIFYWAWWIAYAPFMGLFVARISKGRTIRELIAVEILGGSIGSWVFFGVLGNTSLYFQLDGTQDLSTMVADGMAPEAIVATIVTVGDRVINFGVPLLIVFTVLAFIFGATTMDSSAYTLSSVATRENEDGKPVEPARWHRFFWAIMLAVVSLSLMFAGGKDSLKALQAASVVVAVPLMVVLIIMTVSFVRMLREDYPEAELHPTGKASEQSE